jgi:hypothetical protein
MSRFSSGFNKQAFRCRVTGAVAVLSLFPLVPVRSQYAYDPNAADEQGVAGIRYFGSAKDSNGALVSGATIMVASNQSSFVFVTDEQGRFHGTLPLDSVADKVTTKCWKVGFQVVQVTKRTGPQGVKPTVQVDCVLRSAPQSH